MNNLKRAKLKLILFKGFNNEIVKLGWLFRDLVKEPPKAYLVRYMYYPDRKTHCGDDKIYQYKNKNVFVEPNRWYNIKMCIKLSENPRQEDTILAWVNGKKVLNNQVMFSLFFGGADETFHTMKNAKVYSRKFVVKGS